MAYIGKTPTVGNFVKLDALTASATASYTMQVDSVDFSPESVNHMLVSLNGVIQAPTTSYTISGSTITFASALTSSDSIDFIMVYGNVLDIGTPSDATVTNAKTNFVSTSSAAGLQIKGDGTTDGTLQLNCSQNSHGVKIKSPAHSASASYTLTLPTTDGSADEFLKTDGSGVLSWATAGGSNEPAFHAYNSAALDNSHNTYFLARFNTEKFDTANAYTNTDGNYKFVVPSGQAGKYMLYTSIRVQNNVGTYIVQAFADIRVNGNSLSYHGFDSNQSQHGRHFSVGGSIVANLSVGDVINVYAFCETGDSNNMRLLGGEESTYFGGFKLI